MDVVSTKQVVLNPHEFVDSADHGDFGRLLQIWMRNDRPLQHILNIAQKLTQGREVSKLLSHEAIAQLIQWLCARLRG